MTTVVIDTNVLLVADGRHEGVSGNGRAACIKRLSQVQATGRVAIDSRRLIFQEYLRNYKDRRQPGVGVTFLKWLLQNKGNAARVDEVPLEVTNDGMFVQFPSAELQAKFDRSDMKFVAVAAAHQGRPPILQAADGKWVGWWEELRDCGVQVEFLCPVDILRFYAGAFPGKPVPELPKVNVQLEAALK
jgi:hypothetical protein